MRHQRGDAAVPDIEMIKGMNGLTLGGSQKTDYSASIFGNYWIFALFLEESDTSSWEQAPGNSNDNK